MSENKITCQRPLRTSRPYWQTTPNIAVRTRNKPSSSHYDVIIIGAGISGALIADALMNNKRRIAIIDRRAPVLGSSMASTAMIQHEIDVPLFKLSKHMQKTDAERVWLRSAKAVDALITRVHELGISCHMQRKKTLYLAGNAYGLRALKAEAEARRSIDLKADFLDANQLKTQFQIDRTAGIVSDVSASANPAQLTAGLLRSAASRGAEIIQNTEITDFISLNDKVVLATSTGALLTASHAIFCTGYEFLKALAHKEHRIISTWAIATNTHANPPSWLHDFLVWEASDPYLYFRMADNGRIIAGGEDEDSGDAYKDEEKLKIKSQNIIEKIRSLTGFTLGKPAHSWAAAFGSTTLGIPMIGELPKFPNVYAAMGYGGNGITFSKIAAEIIASQLNGKDDPDAKLFPFR